MLSAEEAYQMTQSQWAGGGGGGRAARHRGYVEDRYAEFSRPGGREVTESG